MIEKIQHATASSPEGAKGLVKGVLACAFQNMAFMLPTGLLYLLVKDLLAGSTSEKSTFYLLGCVACFVLILLITWFQYNGTYFTTYKESGTRRLTLAERLRKLPLSFFGKRDLADLTSTIMADCEVLEKDCSHFIPGLFGSLISTVLIALSLFAFEWRMALAALWVIPVSVAIVVGSYWVQDKVQARTMAAKMACADGIQEYIETLRDLKASNAEQRYLSGLSGKIRAVEKQSIVAELTTALFVSSAGMVLKLGIASVALTGSVLLVQGRIAAALTNDPELQQLCREYLSVNLVFCWGIFLQTYGQRLLQAVGDTVLSMVSLIIGAVVNIILDPIMIFGLLGCPAMGIRGAAIATVIGRLIGAAAALWFNRVKNPVIHVRLKGYRFLWQDVADIYRVGLPTIVMQAIGSVMTFAVNGILLGVSSAAVAFFGIYYKLQNFLMMPVNGLGQAAIPVVGFNYGSGQSHRVKQAWKVLLPTGVVFALCGTAVFLLFPAQLLGLFSASDEMLAFGVPALRIISVTFLFAVTTILCGYFASGLGNGVVNMIGGALRQLVVLVPCLWLLIRTMGIDKAWFAFWVSEVVACAYSLWATKKELRNKVK